MFSASSFTATTIGSTKLYTFQKACVLTSTSQKNIAKAQRRALQKLQGQFPSAGDERCTVLRRARTDAAGDIAGGGARCTAQPAVGHSLHLF